MMKDWTAAELADALDDVGRAIHSTGALSMLSEAALDFTGKLDEIAGAYREFDNARFAHMDSYKVAGEFTDESWRAAVDAASRLASVLRPLGDMVIARCKRPTGWGVCNLLLDDAGECRSALGHEDEAGGLPKGEEL